jgi:hypothetical protein
MTLADEFTISLNAMAPAWVIASYYASASEKPETLITHEKAGH